MPNIGNKLFSFFSGLQLTIPPETGITVMNPYTNKHVRDINRQFYSKFYNDTYNRVLVLGINPGRFGGGITGISFTDPVVLEARLDISNNFKKTPELSATFVHEAINKFGGPQVFYRKFIVSAVCPLGFIKNNVNINYYDDRQLLRLTMPFIIDKLNRQKQIAGSNNCICIGMGKNLDILKEINKTHNFFETIHALPHPRWVMQYRRKETNRYLNEYNQLFHSV
ncbi:MAG: DUF4918 family protein [Bacteroidales bacterium]|nr:DUF4918 family protein [Bacteroidales bacterium]